MHLICYNKCNHLSTGYPQVNFKLVDFDQFKLERMFIYMAIEKISPQGNPVTVFNNENLQNNYISLTDIAKYKSDSPADLIKNWLRARSTIEYIGLWEQLNNKNFNTENYSKFLSDSGSNTFILSPKKWIDETNALGIISKSGRYGGTYATSDIAFEFASWISADFKLYLIKDYQQLKEKDNSQFNLDWNLNRTMAKLNYKLHTDAIKNNIVPHAITTTQAKFSYTNEADRLNVALFGMTAREWRNKNPEKEKKGNIRDFSTKEQLLVLVNLESMNAELIRNKTPEIERTQILNDMARQQLTIFLNNEKKLK